MDNLKVIKYGTSWCNPCKLQEKEFENNSLKVPVEYIDVDNLEYDAIDKLKIKTVPVIILYKEKEEINRWVGFTKSEVINEYINNL